jgi:CHASE3 domain sensor protein
MQKRPVRFMVVALLLACGLIAAYFLWAIDQRSNTSVVTQAEVSAHLGGMSETIAAIGAAQQSYVAPGQLDGPWFERTSTLVEQLSSDIETARARLKSPVAAEALQALASSTEALIAADARTRQNLRLGQELMASDVIFSDGRNILDAMIAGLRDLQAAEHASHRAELSALSRRRWIALDATALFWVAGLFALVTIPASGTSAAERPSPRVPAESSSTPPEQRPRVEPRPSVDLASTASLCTDFSRVTTTAALPDLLGRTARVLDASGVILWMSAGEQLFPVIGHGYRPEMLARLGAIARNAENAAAAAWRTQQLTIVGARGPTDTGAIVAPLFGLHACIGVLAAEIRHGGERNPATQALATIIAAQLATVVPAWPAPSLTRPAAQGVEPEPAPKDATREARFA